MSDKVCYLLHNSKLGRSGSVPCGVTNSSFPNVACCVAGDTCMSNGLCYYTHSHTEGSGYYVSDCTDPTFDSPGCRTSCSDSVFSDAVWDNAAQIWKCCAYTPGLNCSHPSSRQFDAPAPANLLSLQYIPSNGLPTYPIAAATTSSTSSAAVAVSSTAGPTSSSSSAASASATSSPSAQPTSGLSSGAQAGIGVGVALGVIVLIAIAGLLFWRKRKRNRVEAQRREELAGTPAMAQNGQNGAYNKYAEAPAYEHSPRYTAPMELQGERPELQGERAPQELGGKPVGG